MNGGGDTPVLNTVFWRDIPNGNGNRIAVNSRGQVIVVPHGQTSDTDDMYRIGWAVNQITICLDRGESLAYYQEEEWGLAETSDAGSEATAMNFTFTYEGTTYHYDGDEHTFTPEISETYNP